MAPQRSRPAAMAVPDDLHEWVSFDDPDEHRTWMFDATFLRSNHRCIWGEGCQGVLDEPAEQLGQGCCSYGAHFVDDDDVQTVVRAFVRTEPRHMQFHRKAARGGFLRPDPSAAEGAEAATVTRLVDGACIFLNRPGFEGGPGCALHIAALDAGERPLDWKPNVCWQVPVRLEHSVVEQPAGLEPTAGEHTVGDNGHVISRLREWRRRDWGEGGDEFAWWCTEAPEAFSGAEPVYVSAREEIVEMIGEGIYERMVAALERPGWTPLPHPTVRR